VQADLQAHVAHTNLQSQYVSCCPPLQWTIKEPLTESDSVICGGKTFPPSPGVMCTLPRVSTALVKCTFISTEEQLSSGSPRAQSQGLSLRPGAPSHCKLREAFKETWPGMPELQWRHVSTVVDVSETACQSDIPGGILRKTASLTLWQLHYVGPVPGDRDRMLAVCE